MRTYEDFYKEKAAEIKVGESNIMVDVDDNQLMIVVKVEQSKLDRIRTENRANGGPGVMPIHLPGRNSIGLSVTSPLDFEGTYGATAIIPINEQTKAALLDVINLPSKYVEFVLVSEAEDDVYGIGIFTNEVSKEVLRGKLEIVGQ
ncbi:hypothetical protein ABES02_29640 [Neobacillus pocheonensis]|uniref:hypothetical protein n=1 Tax=Neobacillus pocheonensis TaxID=363869 RepID=UPI003D289B37